MHGFTCTSVWRLLGAATAIGVLAACGQKDAADDASPNAPEAATVKSAGEALAGAHVPTLDPATLNDAEIRKVIGPRPVCTFRYTSSGRPVLVAALEPDGRPGPGLIKFNGSLVSLQPAAVTEPGPAGWVLAAEPVRLQLQPPPDAGRQLEAELVFEVGQQLKVGYAGFLACTKGPPSSASR